MKSFNQNNLKLIAFLFVVLLFALIPHVYANGPEAIYGYVWLFGFAIVSAGVLFVFSIIFWIMLRKRKNYKILSPTTIVLLAPILINSWFFYRNLYFTRFPLLSALFFHIPLTTILLINGLVAKEVKNKKIFFMLSFIYFIFAVCLTVIHGDLRDILGLKFQ